MAGTIALLVGMVTTLVLGQLNTDEQALLLMFEKPYQPLWKYRGPEGNTVFDLPENMRPGIASATDNVGIRFGGGPPPNQISVTPSVVNDADLGFARSVPRGGPFSMFIQAHRRAARDLVKVLMRSTDAKTLIETAAGVRPRVNEFMFINCLAYVMTNVPAFRNVKLPPLEEVLPSMFVPETVIAKAKQMVADRPFMENRPERVVISHGREFSGTEQNPEQRISYFREDYGINAHHWHWHLLYPIEMQINRDRKGELFYYMHQQIVTRYDMERLSNGLPRVTRFENFRQEIAEGYFSKLTIGPTGRPYGSRQDNSVLRNFAQPVTSTQLIVPFDISELERSRSLILDAINQDFMVNRTGGRVPLTDEVPLGSGRKRGVDILGDTFEADADLSVNYGFYGDLHNLGHIAMAYVHDPEGYHSEQMGVMATSGTAMRDPIFYRWHKFVDHVFQTYKRRQPPYTQAQLVLEGVEVQRVGVSTDNVDELQTGWSTRQIEASRGLDFGDTSVPVTVNLTHLNNRPFIYHVLVNNKGAERREVTVRIFLAPKRNERRQDFLFNDQRLLWAEMDRFTHTLEPGRNHVQRPSASSSLTQPSEFTFRQLDTGDIQGTPAATDYCGCGWPQHMLVPRGRPEGMTFQLFVMLTDTALDTVGVPQTENRCGKAHIFCGVRDGLYPDSRPMGFPFDRTAPLSRTITDFARIENAAVQDVTVRFLDRFL